MTVIRLLVFFLPLAYLEAQSSDSLIRSALREQTAAWNNADLPRFVATYAERCTLVGTDISVVTRSQVLAHYRQKYSSPAKMGHLTFSNLQVSMLDSNIATAVGRWHLDRDPSSGGAAGGVFSLVFQKQQDSWFIILDHTS